MVELGTREEPYLGCRTNPLRPAASMNMSTPQVSTASDECHTRHPMHPSEEVVCNTVRCDVSAQPRSLTA